MVYDRFVTILLLTVGQNNYNLHRKFLRLKDGETLYVHVSSNYHPTDFFWNRLDFAPQSAYLTKKLPLSLLFMVSLALMKLGDVAGPAVPDIC